MSSARRTRRCFIEYLNADRDLVSTLQRSDMTPEQKDSMLEFTSKGLHSAFETSGDKIWARRHGGEGCERDASTEG